MQKSKFDQQVPSSPALRVLQDAPTFYGSAIRLPWCGDTSARYGVSHTIVFLPAFVFCDSVARTDVA